MKYFIFIFCLFMFCFSISASAQQEANIYIPVLKTDKLIYSQNEKIQSEFEIDNNSQLRQSDIYITSSIVTKVNDKNIELNIQKHQAGVYLEAKSKRKINIEHVVNAGINGPAEFVVSAFLKDGSLVGQKRNPIVVNNQNAKEIIAIDSAYVMVENDKFNLQSGPTVSKNSPAYLEFVTSEVSKNISVQPKIDLYDRTQITDNPIRTITPDIITFSSNNTYSIALPTDLDSKVYEGVLSFPSSEVTITPLYFRYIIEGPIGTIINTNASQLSVKKGDKIQILIQYAGTPLIVEPQTDELLNFEKDDPLEISIPEGIDVEALSDDEFKKLVEQITEQELETNQNQIDEKKASIKVSLIDEKGDVIGIGNTNINLNNSGTVSIDVDVIKKAKKFSIVSEMTLENGTVLSSYKTSFPSEDELEKVYGKKINIPSWINTLSIGIGFILILLVVLLIRKKMKHYTLILIIPFSIMIGSFVFLYTSEAFTVNFASYANAAAHFRVNSIFSPGPADSVSYEPGEAFTLNLNASFVACNNSGFTNMLYGPPDDWWNFNLNDLYSTFNYQEVQAYRVGRSRSFRLVYNNVAGYYGDSWGNGVVLPRFGEWWTKRGSLSSVPYGAFQSGFYTPSVGKGGYHFVQTSSWGSGLYGVGGHEYSSNYNMNPGHTYYMPTEPGFHTFYFMLQNYARGNTSSVRIVSQIVCVRGAGVCLNEKAPETNICPNLIGTFTQNESGQIFQDNIATNYIKDSITGNCVQSACAPALQPSNFGEACGCSATGVIGTIGCSGSCVTSSGAMIPSSCPALSVSCVANPLSIEPTTSTQFKAKPQNALGSVTYRWLNESDVLLGTGETLTRTYDDLGSYLVKIEATNGAQTATNTCRVSVANVCSNEHTNGQDAGCSGGTKHVYVCTQTGWDTISTGETCGGVPGGGVPVTPADASVSLFSFDPDTVASASDMCGLTLVASNVISCTLKSPIENISVPVTGAFISLTDWREVSIGRYTLSCEGTNGVTKQFGVRSCIMNPNIRER